ncbi:MAG: hypothetical protein DRN49_00400 [Thaumarchaeota archaeon]|nr:MAG: hypothetical protein DRN49_00400 [Nitrososphaerota archaeon]
MDVFSVLFYPSIGEDAIFSRGEGLIRIAKFNRDLPCLAGFQTDYDGGADSVMGLQGRSLFAHL